MKTRDPVGAAVPWAGGRPHAISNDEQEYIIPLALTHPTKLGCSFTHWSLRKLVTFPADNAPRRVKIRRERLQQILHDRISDERLAHRDYTHATKEDAAEIIDSIWNRR
jgi:hypothetical protein